MKNRFASIALTFVMILGCMITNTDFNVNTVCADPYNIEIKVETKEISIEEIPEDRLVPLEVCLSNVPNEELFAINIAFQVDSKIIPYINNCWDKNTIESLATSTSIMNTDIIYFSSVTLPTFDRKIKDGRIYDFLVYLPNDIQEGYFFEITPVDSCNNEYETDITSFSLFKNKTEIYGPSNFSFRQGGIKIRSSQAEQQISYNPVSASDNVISNSQSEIPNIQSQINNETTNEITTLTSQETINSTVSAASSTKSTTALSSITSKKSTESETNIIINTESLNSSEVTEENSSNSNFIILILVLLCLLIMGVALIIIFKRSKKDSNDDQH